jgi:hypothetical protein
VLAFFTYIHIQNFQDLQAGSALWHGGHFLAPGIDLFQPGLLFKVFWNVLTTTDA